MKDKQAWVILDTETNGINDPIYVVDIAAQRMIGWEPVGEPFQVLLNQNVFIPPEASRINGYTREILERDGVSAEKAYTDLRKYIGDSPVASYNLEFDWDRVLTQEWKRLGIQPIGTRGVCIYRLTQRLLDPIPAGNCKLQTLRQFYRLPERGAHSALGDVLTVIDLIAKVLQPICENQNLNSLIDLQSFISKEWYPTRLNFGKFKGRSFRDARNDRELRGWLEWLSQSKNEKTFRMAAWYLSQLETEDDSIKNFTAAAIDTNTSSERRGEIRSGIILFQSVELDEIRYLVTAAQERLADLEVIYARECNLIAVCQARLFSLLKTSYHRRDNLRLKVTFRKRYLDSLTSGNDDLDNFSNDFKSASEKSDQEYTEASEMAESQKSLNEDQQAELKALFRKLVKIFHPDRHANNPETYKAYTRLTQEITTARDSGDIEKLREIANDPQAFARKIGAGLIDLSDESELEKLKRLYESLQSQILEMLEALDELHSDPKFELAQLAARRPNYLSEVAKEYENALNDECSALEQEAADLADQIEELTGSSIAEGEL